MNKSILRIAAVVTLFGCTPAQQQAAVTSIDDSIKCIATQLSANPMPTPTQVAIACGLAETPDFTNLVSTLLATRKNPACTVVLVSTVDAGAPKGPGI